MSHKPETSFSECLEKDSTPFVRKMVEGVQPQQLPDLVICDVMMPEMDGFGVPHSAKNP